VAIISVWGDICNFSNLNLTLPGVGWVILEDFDGNDLISAFLPTLHYLWIGMVK